MFALDVGTGTPVFLIHGFGLDHRSLLPLEPAFELAGPWRRVYLDLPGAGGTPAGEIGSTQQVADAVVRQIRNRVGDEPFAILGNSFGGMIARYVAHELRGQVLGLATIAGVFVAPHDQRAVPPRTVLSREPAVETILGTALAQYREDAVVESREGARAFVQHVRPGLDGFDPHALSVIAANYALDREPETAHPDPFLRPTLHLTGRQNHVVGYSDAGKWIEHYPRATYATLDGAGHAVLFERAGLASALVGDWLARVRNGY